jgi:hypothetical protein
MVKSLLPLSLPWSVDAAGCAIATRARGVHAVTSSTPQAAGSAAERPGVQWFNVERAGDPPRLDERHILMLFWSPSSVPCLQAVDVVLDVAPRYRRRLQPVGVHCPRHPSEREMRAARSAAERLGWQHPVAHDPDGLLRAAHGVESLPTMVLLRPDGSSVRFTGAPEARRLREALDELIPPAGEEPLEVVAPVAPPGRGRATTLRFPAAIKPLQGSGVSQRWAVVDSGHHQVVLLDDSGRERMRFGSGEMGFEDGPADRAKFRAPQGLICGADAIFVADTGNHAIRRIDLNERRVSTVAGSRRRGRGLPGTPCDALATGLASPWDLELDGSDLYFSNAGTHQLGVYDCIERTVRLFAGTGAPGAVDGPARQVPLTQPSALRMEESGDRLFFCDSDRGLVRAVRLDERPTVETVYGPGSGRTSFEGRLQFALGLACAEGQLIIADTYNDRLLAVRLDETGIADDVDSLWRGFPQILSRPAGVWTEDMQRILVADRDNHRIVEYLVDEGRCGPWPLDA